MRARSLKSHKPAKDPTRTEKRQDLFGFKEKVVLELFGCGSASDFMPFVFEKCLKTEHFVKFVAKQVVFKRLFILTVDASITQYMHWTNSECRPSHLQVERRKVSQTDAPLLPGILRSNNTEKFEKSLNRKFSKHRIERVSRIGAYAEVCITKKSNSNSTSTSWGRKPRRESDVSHTRLRTQILSSFKASRLSNRSSHQTDAKVQESSTELIRPDKNRYQQALDYFTYRLVHTSCEHNESFANNIATREKTAQMQMRSHMLYTFEPLSVISFLAAYGVTCNIEGSLAVAAFGYFMFW